jgi:hypothetical protein
MDYKDTISAYKAGVIKVCQDNGIPVKTQDELIAAIDLQRKAGEAIAAHEPILAHIAGAVKECEARGLTDEGTDFICSLVKEAAGVAQNIEQVGEAVKTPPAAKPATPAAGGAAGGAAGAAPKPEAPKTEAPKTEAPATKTDATPDPGDVRPAGDWWGSYTKGWKDDPGGMLMQTLPWLIGGGLLGGLGGGGKGAGIGAGLGLLGPLAWHYFNRNQPGRAGMSPNEQQQVVGALQSGKSIPTIPEAPPIPGLEGGDYGLIPSYETLIPGYKQPV